MYQYLPCGWRGCLLYNRTLLSSSRRESPPDTSGTPFRSEIASCDATNLAVKRTTSKRSRDTPLCRCNDCSLMIQGTTSAKHHAYESEACAFCLCILLRLTDSHGSSPTTCTYRAVPNVPMYKILVTENFDVSLDGFTDLLQHHSSVT